MVADDRADAAHRLTMWAILAGLAAVFWSTSLAAAAEPRRTEPVSAAAELKDGIPGPDVAALPAALADKPPESVWLRKRTERYAALFNGTRCDVLLVPMQVEGGGFDRPSRDIMTAQLALALASSGSCVTDPYVTDVALGEGLRRRDPEQIQRLARVMQAHEIVTAYCGHYPSARMRVTLQRNRLDRADPAGRRSLIAAHSFEFAGYDAQHPAFAVFQAHLAEMLTSIGIKADPGPAAAVRGGAMPAALPQSLDEYLHPDRRPTPGPLADAAALTFLAMQAPAEWRAADRLFSKAWVALGPADDADPAVRLLRARILLHLDQRPYALSIIRADRGPEAEGLRAILNGNLPPARQALAQVKGPWEKFSLGIEVSDLELAYARDPRASARHVRTALGSSVFAPFVYRRLLEPDRWSWSTTLDMKSTLDDAFKPSKGGWLSDLTAGVKAAAGLADPSDELASIQRVHRLIEEQPRVWCCSSFAPGPRPSDLLDLLDARIEHTLGRQAYYYISPQGQYKTALSTLEGYDDELSGSPYAESMRALIYWMLLRTGELEHREEWTKAMHEAARLAVWWSQAQTPDTDQAVSCMGVEPRDPAAQYFLRVTDDYPIRQHWRAGVDSDTQVERLAFSTDHPAPLIDLLNKSTGDARLRYQQELSARFLGAKESTQRRLEQLPRNLKTVDHLRSEIEADRDNWQIYRALAYLQLHQKAFAAVRQTVLSYPPFREKEPKDPVTLSNYASESGHTLLWQGAIDDAQPLLERAAGYETGSEAGSVSGARVALLQAQYTEAADWFVRAGYQYNDLTAYRELVCLLFAAGQDQAAWSLFGKLVSRYKATGFWTSAMVGHRRANISDADLSTWYRDQLSRLGPDDRDALRSHAFLEQTIDRKLSADLPGLMQGLASSSEVSAREDGKVYLAHPPADSAAQIGPSEFGRQRHPKLTARTQVPDKYALALQALVAMQGGRYEEAMIRFDEFSSYYRIEREFILPYFAFSAAKAGDRFGLHDYLDHLPYERRGFEVTLARAVFAAMSGRSSEALALLDGDFENWAYVHANYFPNSAYQYISLCALLYEARGDAAYRERALKLARILRRVEPAFAYGHAAVAYLGSDRVERADALTTALYLDPRSRWAGNAPESLRAAAKASLAAAGNPFVRGLGQSRWRAIDEQVKDIAK